jgi:hypothetical protein
MISTVYRKFNAVQKTDVWRFRGRRGGYSFEIYNSESRKWGLKVLGHVEHRSTYVEDPDQTQDGLLRGTGLVAPWQETQSFGVGL